jgi:nitric oxide reductase NorQ protein
MGTDFYQANGNEVQLFERAFNRHLPVMLTGPTGCGKTRFVEYMGQWLSRLYLDRADEVVKAPETFMLVCSYNPAYRSSLKELKPSFRQRFVTIAMDYLPPDRQAEVLVAEAGIEPSIAERLVRCATSIRTADDVFHFEPPSTRVLVTAAQLIATGADEAEAVEACVLVPLSTDGAITNGLREAAAASLLAAKTPTARSV